MALVYNLRVIKRNRVLMCSESDVLRRRTGLEVEAAAGITPRIQVLLRVVCTAILTVKN
jgi:hypothetical protein